MTAELEDAAGWGQTRLSDAVAAVVDHMPIGAVQYRALAICMIVAVLDGFDLTTMALAAPVIAEEWDVAAEKFGPVLAAALLGLGLGAMIAGPLGDRYGRKPLIIASCFLISAGSLLSATSESSVELLAWRLLTGVGLGTAMPNLYAMIAEMMPARRRILATGVMACAVSVGGMIAGAVAPTILAAASWKGFFLLGGLLPLLIAIVAFVALDESPKYLAGPHGNEQRFAAVLTKFGIARNAIAGERIVTAIEQSPVRALLRPPHIIVTLSYALAWACNTFIFYLLISWTPLLLTRSGLDMDSAMHSLSFLYGGAIVGGLLLSWLLDRMSERFAVGTILLYVTGAGALAAFLVAPLSFWLGLIAIVGMLIGGGIYVLPGIAGRLYPSQMLATGLGLVVTLSRIGAVAAPLAGSWAIAQGWSPTTLFAMLAIPSMLAATAMLPIWLLKRSSTGGSVAEVHTGRLAERSLGEPT